MAGNSVFIGSGDGSIYAVDVKSGKQKWTYEIGDNIRSSPAITEGKLVIGCDDGKIYCFAETKK